MNIRKKIQEELQNIICKNCDWKWDVEKDDKNPYLCHKCGYDNKKNEFDHKSFNKWKSDNKINESTMDIRKIIQEELKIVFDDTTISINLGDEILGGKFKNKKIKVKEIGTNEKGDITINGRPLMRFRIPKED
jgi:transcription initiation factor TFIIIB Brf1 subunit/transcription initiation factor TFIIB